MTDRKVSAVAAALLATVAGTVALGQSHDHSVEILLEASSPDTLTDAHVHEANGFRIESARIKELDLGPTDELHPFQIVSVTAADIFKVSIEKGRPTSAGGGIGVFHRDAGTPKLQRGDNRWIVP